jgi:hypothetical protein
LWRGGHQGYLEMPQKESAYAHFVAENVAQQGIKDWMVL